MNRLFVLMGAVVWMVPTAAAQYSLDNASCTTIHGWAYNGSSPQTPVTVQIKSDGILVGTALANLYRPDLVASGQGGNGYVGFNINTPSGLKDGASHYVSANLDGYGAFGGAQITCPLGAANYSYPETATTNPGPSDPGNWAASGTINSGYPGGSYLWSQTPAGWNGEYEVSTNITLTTSGGFYQHYVRAQTGAVSGYGTSYLVELQNPTFNATGQCSATLSSYQVVNTSSTLMNQATIPCTSHMVMRTVVFSNLVYTMINGELYGAATTQLTGGLPGFGAYAVPSGNTISQVAVGPRNTASPAPIDPATVAYSAFPDHVDVRWQDPADTTGVGISSHYLFRNGAPYLGGSPESGDITDSTVAASTTYSYAICEYSFHGIVGGCDGLNITTPAAGNIDPRRYGVRATGSYWGDKGEQIDTFSGNLNYTLPMFSANNRGGRTFNFALSYNSQMWRSDSGGTWMLGQDVGYGMGWKLQAGSLTPYYFGGNWTSNVDHFVFSDSTGAEYRLTDPNHTGVWTSQDSIYVSYDFNANRLYFNDGSFWIMGCTSGGSEPDLGTMYPTQMEDSNGNYIRISYYSGAGTSWPNSSGRINQVFDNLGAYAQPYQFIYDLNSGKLQQIQLSNAGVQKSITFAYVTQATSSPFANPVSMGNTMVLTGVTNAPGYTTALAYNASDELTQVTFPTGGHFKYDYLTWNYQAAGGQARQIREVSMRHLAQNADGSGDLQYPITRGADANDGTLVAHTRFNIADPSGIGAKLWSFNAGGSTPWKIGMAASLQEILSTGSTAAPRQYLYTWAQDPVGNPYISEKQTVLDGGTAYSKTSYEDQTLDQYGNMLTRNIRDYLNGTLPIRKYTFTYLTDSNYTGRYIRNRLLTASVTDGNGNYGATLVTNRYDQQQYLLPYDCSAQAPDMSGAPNHDPAYSDPLLYRGNVTLQTTPQGVTCTLHDLLGNAYFSKAPHSPAVTTSTGVGTNYSLPTAITSNGDSNSTVAVSYSAFLTPSGFAGPNGANANVLYDLYGRAATSTSPDGALTNYTYSLGAAPLTQLAVTGVQGYSGLTSATWTQTTVDGLGRAVKVQSGPGTTPGNAVTETDTVYGPCACSPTGKMKQVSQPFAPGAPVYWTTYAYDAIGRTVSVQLPDGASTTHYSYQGNAATVTDPAGKTKTTTADVQGNTTQVIEPDPANQPSGTLQTNYTYDTMEHLIQVSMPRGTTTQIRSFVYDATTHLLTSETHPETGTTSYAYGGDVHTYDLLGAKTDANGRVTTYAYDPYYRATAIRRFSSQTALNQAAANPDGTYDDVCERVKYTYDSYYDGSFYSSNSWGRVAAVSTGDPTCYVDGPTQLQEQFTQMYSYTGSGHVFTKRLQLWKDNGGDPSLVGTPYWDVNYRYNAFGQVVSTKYPDAGGLTGQTYTVGYDTMRRPNYLTDSRGTVVVAGVAFNAANQPFSTAFYQPNSGSLMWENRGYNQLNQLTAINGYTSTTVSNGTSVNVTYNYPATQNNGQITSMTDNLQAQTVNYTYDALKRLTAATGVGSNAWSQSYTYDGFGNMTAKAGSGSVFTSYVDPSTNRLAFGNFCYDPSGNMVSDQNGGGCTSPNYWYDFANRLVLAKSSGGATESYQYGADNKRLGKIVNGPNLNPTQAVYVYGAAGELLSVMPSTGGMGVNNVYFGGRMIKQNTDLAAYGYNSSPMDNNFVITDRLGSVGGGLTTGGPNYHISYLPYGDQMAASTPDQPVFNQYATLGSQTGFATYFMDGNTGLAYADQRYYSAGYGRFMSADRFRQAAKANDSGSWNKYSYTRGDPVNRTDSAGTCDDEDGCSIGELEAGELGVEFEGGAEGNSITVSDDIDPTDPVFTATGICGEGCTTSPDPTDTVFVLDPVTVILNRTLDLTGSGSGNTCVAASITLGGAVGGGVGSFVGGAGGGLGGGVSGTALLPGLGTFSVGLLGAELGATGGGLWGGTLGSAIGGVLGNIFCSSVGPSGKPTIHIVNHPSRKRAKDGARNDGQGPPIHHPTPTQGRPHYHPTDGDGIKIPGVHHTYPQ